MPPPTGYLPPGQIVSSRGAVSGLLEPEAPGGEGEVGEPAGEPRRRRALVALQPDRPELRVEDVDAADRSQRHAEVLAGRALLEDVDLVDVAKAAGVPRDADLALARVPGCRLASSAGARVAAGGVEAALEEGDLVGGLEPLGGQVEARLDPEGARRGGEAGERGDRELRAGRFASWLAARTDPGSSRSCAVWQASTPGALGDTFPRRVYQQSAPRDVPEEERRGRRQRMPARLRTDWDRGRRRCARDSSRRASAKVPIKFTRHARLSPHPGRRRT